MVRDEGWVDARSNQPPASCHSQALRRLVTMRVWRRIVVVDISSRPLGYARTGGLQPGADSGAGAIGKKKIKWIQWFSVYVVRGWSPPGGLLLRE